MKQWTNDDLRQIKMRRDANGLGHLLLSKLGGKSLAADEALSPNPEELPIMLYTPSTNLGRGIFG